MGGALSATRLPCWECWVKPWFLKRTCYYLVAHRELERLSERTSHPTGEVPSHRVSEIVVRERDFTYAQSYVGVDFLQRVRMRVIFFCRISALELLSRLKR